MVTIRLRRKVKRVLKNRTLIARVLIALCVVVVGFGVMVYLTAGRQAAPLRTPARHVMGDLRAPITMTVFTDYECPYCKGFHERYVKQLQKKYGNDVVYVYKNFPRDEHKGAYLKALIAECIAQIDGEDAYWKFVDRLFAVDQPIANNEFAEAGYVAAHALGIPTADLRTCVDRGESKQTVDNETAEGSALGVIATPGIVIEGAGKQFVIQGTGGTDIPVAIDYIRSKLKLPALTK